MALGSTPSGVSPQTTAAHLRRQPAGDNRLWFSGPPPPASARRRLLHVVLGSTPFRISPQAMVERGPRVHSRRRQPSGDSRKPPASARRRQPLVVLGSTPSLLIPSTARPRRRAVPLPVRGRPGRESMSRALAAIAPSAERGALRDHPLSTAQPRGAPRGRTGRAVPAARRGRRGKSSSAAPATVAPYCRSVARCGHRAQQRQNSRSLALKIVGILEIASS